MFSKKEKMVLTILNVVEGILLLIAYVVFTLLFRLDKTVIRYLFLLGDIGVIIAFSKLLSLFDKEKTPVLNKNIDSQKQEKYAKKMSV